MTRNRHGLIPAFPVAPPPPASRRKDLLGEENLLGERGASGIAEEARTEWAASGEEGRVIGSGDVEREDIELRMRLILVS